MKRADLERYFQKSGDTKLSTGEFIENEHGFAIFRVASENDTIYVLSAYGDGKYWQVFFEALAGVMHIKKLMFGTRRNPKAFERKYGYKVVGYILEKEVA